MDALLLILGAWLGCDLLHYLWIAVRRRCWEQTDARGPDGLRAGAQGFDVGSGDTAVLFIHGFADIPAVFRPMSEALVAGGGIHCRALRLPGAGEPLAAAAAVTLDDWLTAVRDTASDLRRDHRRVWLVGHSLGGALALAAALRQPGLVDGVGLLAPMLAVSRRRSPILPPRTWMRLAQAVFPFSRTFESCFSTDVAAADGVAFSYRRDRFIPFSTYRNLFALIDWLQPRAEELRLPTFAAVVEGDPTVDTGAALAWLARSPSAHKEVRRLPDGRHAIPTEPGWKEVTTALRSFILANL